MIVSDTEHQEVLKIEKLLTLLAEVGVILKPRQLNLFQKKIEYLGHVFLKSRLEAAAKNNSTIKTAVFSKIRAQMQSSFGACNVYNSAVKNFLKFLDHIVTIYVRKGN